MKIVRVFMAFEHLVSFSTTDREYYGTIANYFKVGLKSGDCFVVVAPRHKLPKITAALENFMDVEKALITQRYLQFAAEDILEEFTLNGRLELKKISSHFRALFKRAALRKWNVRCYGEIAPELFLRGQKKTAIQLEKFCTQLAEKYHMSFLCGYHGGKTDFTDNIQTIRTLHTAVVT